MTSVVNASGIQRRTVTRSFGTEETIDRVPGLGFKRNLVKPVAVCELNNIFLLLSPPGREASRDH